MKTVSEDNGPSIHTYNSLENSPSNTESMDIQSETPFNIQKLQKSNENIETEGTIKHLRKAFQDMPSTPKTPIACFKTKDRTSTVTNRTLEITDCKTTLQRQEPVDQTETLADLPKRKSSPEINSNSIPFGSTHCGNESNIFDFLGCPDLPFLLPKKECTTTITTTNLSLKDSNQNSYQQPITSSSQVVSCLNCKKAQEEIETLKSEVIFLSTMWACHKHLCDNGQS